uniref:Myelin oligodendrocyte glycoprotein n=1 Tax=Rattus norvegicus TaxID=10116 RepID=A0ABK0LQ85_RAT
MAQWLRALIALPEAMSSIPSYHMVAHNHLEWDPMPSSGVSEDSNNVLTYLKTNKSKKKKKKKKRQKQFRVIGPGHPIRALVGDEAELPCRISPGKNATGMEVGWYRSPFSRVVHLYRNGKDQDAEQAPEYRGRTELLKESIGEGKVALRIQNVRFSDEGGYTCFFRDHSYQEEAAVELKVEDPFYWINPGVLALIALVPMLLLQVSVGLVFLFLQHRLRENLHRTFDPHFLRVPCWKITLFVIVPVLGPLVALIICYNWLHRRLAGQFLEELRNPF